MNIFPIPNEHGRFRVISENIVQCAKCNRVGKRLASGLCKCGATTEPVIYLQDLHRNRGAGECDCPYHQCKVGPAFARGEWGHKTCKHLTAAHYLFSRNYWQEQWQAYNKRMASKVCEV